MSEPTSPPPTRVRWSWIVGCIVLGLAGIGAGFVLVAPGDRRGYAASVLAGVGTTLLLVGFVVLLERRIVDSTTKAVQSALDARRAASDARIDRMVADYEDRMTAEWSHVDPDDKAATRRRAAQLTDEVVERVIDESLGSATTRRKGPESAPGRE